MTKKKKTDSGKDEAAASINDEDTNEVPVLDASAFDGAEPDAPSGSDSLSAAAAASHTEPDALNGALGSTDDTAESDAGAAADLAADEAQSDPATYTGQRAAEWLRRMDSEIERLRSKWGEVERVLKRRDARIHELELELENRQAELEQALETSDSEIEEARARFEQEIAELRRELDTTASAKSALEGELEEARTQVSETGERSVALARDNEKLRSNLQDLELYIEGRKSDWSSLNSKLGRYKDTIAGMERTIKGHDAELKRKNKEREAMGVRVMELERQCAELTGRRQERETDCRELQTKLEEQIKARQELQSELKRRDRSSEDAEDKLIAQNKLVTSLERGVERRDQTIAELEAASREHRETAERLQHENDKLIERSIALETSLEERAQSARTLRAELKEAHGQVETLQSELAEKEAYCMDLQTGSNESQRILDELRAELAHASAERDELTAALEAAEQRIDTLVASLDDVQAEAASLQGEMSAQQNLVSRLEADLQSRERVIESLDESAQRLNDLSLSLRELDCEIDADEDPADSGDSMVSLGLALDDADLFDIGEPGVTLPSGAASRAEARGAEPLSRGANGATNGNGTTGRWSIGSPSGRSAAGHDEAGKRNGSNGNGSSGAWMHATAHDSMESAGDAPRKILILGEGTQHPILKADTTIGRSTQNDICIRSVFVSRVHARLLSENGGTFIEDAGSKNGILVNYEPVKRQLLHHGDIVSLGGKLDLKYVELDAH